ncbi:MAG TPA: hypothetical protein VFG52_11810 [Xanthomonadales bacterium]|nr:hypothetical protein [Xanthomonadales bacterium]
MVTRYLEQYALEYRDWDDGKLRTVKFLDHIPETGLAISPDGRYALLARIVQQRSDLMVADAEVPGPQ